jgi:hypothetical protein
MQCKLNNARVGSAGAPHVGICAAPIRLVASILALLMLISLPADRAHSFTTHLRAPVVRRTTQSQTSIAQPEISATQRLHKCGLAPSPLASIGDVAVVRPRPRLKVTMEVLPARLLRHLKLGFARTSTPDPLS